jgi:hypothetical protein
VYVRGASGISNRRGHPGGHAWARRLILYRRRGRGRGAKFVALPGYAIHCNSEYFTVQSYLQPLLPSMGSDFINVF